MEKRKLSLTESWDRVVELLVQLKEAWEEHMELWLETPRDEVQNLSPEYQRFLARNFNRSKFDIVLPRLVDFWRTIGGVKALRVKAEKPKLDPEEILQEALKKKNKED